MALTAAQMAARYQAGMASPQAKQKYVDGVNGVQTSPTQLAAAPAAQALYVQNTAAAANSGRMANALNAVSLNSWQQSAINKGAPRLASGAAAAANKVAAHFNKWAPIYMQASQAAAAIQKDGTTATALAKVEAAINIMKQAAGKS